MLRRKTILLTTVAVLSVASIILFIPWNVIQVWIRPIAPTVEEEVENTSGYDIDGIIVYVDREGKDPVHYAAGWKDRDLKIPADPHALFKIASISKLYIAAATTMQIAEGKLSLESTVSDLFPQLVGRIENADRITLRMLLQHRSGIPDWIDDPEFPWDTSLPEVSQYLELVLDDPAEFAPGQRYDYSNTNYLLLGMILDQTLEYDHNLYIKNEILKPLGLSNTYPALSEVDTSKLTSGYYTEYDGDLKMFDIVSPGGSMIATAEDVGKFIRALNDGSFFSNEEQEIYSSVYEYGHTGEWAGYLSIARYHSDIDAVVILFVNTSGGRTWSIADAVYERILTVLREQ